MEARTILRKLREGEIPAQDELTWFALGLADGRISDAQAGAFAMAVFQAELGDVGRLGLTRAMRESGDQLAWQLDGPIVDKHSTGGVGDCTSLIVAPALASCGAYVPMISGRGLGHTGGTLDKLEAIPGYNPDVPIEAFQELVADIGLAIVGASSQMAPADRRLYAIRDVTATVASIDLITASILSKKLAAGLESLVLDVKTGSGAFLADPLEALELAQALVSTARAAGCRTSALVTDMSQPLARSAGNALEVIEVMKILTNGELGSELARLSVSLGGEALALAGIAPDAAAGEAQIAASIRTGSAAEAFGQMIDGLGGPRDFVQNWRDRLPAASVLMDVHPHEAGIVQQIDTRALGECVTALGGGRRREDDRIDHSVGLSQIARIGEPVDAGRPVARIHASDEARAEAIAADVIAAFTLGGEARSAHALVQERIS